MKEYRFDPEIQLDFKSLIPLRVQIFNQIQKAVMRKRVPPGTRVISESQIAKTFSINRGTVHLAYLDLMQYGLIETKSARGGVRIARDAAKLYKPPFPTLNLVLPVLLQKHIKQHNIGSLEYISGILDRAAEKKISVNFIALPSPDLSPEEIEEWLDGFVPHSIGTITMGTRIKGFDPVLDALINYKNIPHVFLTGTTCLPHISTVSADITKGFTAFLDHLKKNKVKEICFINQTGEVNNQFGSSFANRISEAIKLAKKRHFHCTLLDFTNEELLVNGCMAERFLAEKKRPEVVFVLNDHLACRFMDELKERDIRIPEDVKIAAYDNTAPAEYELSSICHNRFELGAVAVDLISELYDKLEKNGTHKNVASSFILRRSLEF